MTLHFFIFASSIFWLKCSKVDFISNYFTCRGLKKKNP